MYTISCHCSLLSVRLGMGCLATLPCFLHGSSIFIVMFNIMCVHVNVTVVWYTGTGIGSGHGDMYVGLFGITIYGKERGLG